MAHTNTVYLVLIMFITTFQLWFCGCYWKKHQDLTTHSIKQAYPVINTLFSACGAHSETLRVSLKWIYWIKARPWLSFSHIEDEILSLADVKVNSNLRTAKESETSSQWYPLDVSTSDLSHTCNQARERLQVLKHTGTQALPQNSSGALLSTQ